MFWGIKEIMENKRAESYSIGSLAELKLLRSCEKSQAHHERNGGRTVEGKIRRFFCFVLFFKVLNIWI